MSDRNSDIAVFAPLRSIGKLSRKISFYVQTHSPIRTCSQHSIDTFNHTGNGVCQI